MLHEALVVMYFLYNVLLLKVVVVRYIRCLVVVAYGESVGLVALTIGLCFSVGWGLGIGFGGESEMVLA